MKECLLFLITIFSIASSYGQTVVPQVVNANGGHFANSDFSLEWSVGELSISTIKSNGNLLTEGFLQPNLPGSVANIDLASSKLQVVPNPFTTWIRLSDSENSETLWNVRLCSSDGQMLLAQRSISELNLEYLSNGMYVLYVSDKNNNFIKSIKISKYN